MRTVFLSILLASAQIHSHDGNLIPEPTLSDYNQAHRSPGIVGSIEDVIDSDGNPSSI